VISPIERMVDGACGVSANDVKKIAESQPNVDDMNKTADALVALSDRAKDWRDEPNVQNRIGLVKAVFRLESLGWWK